MESELATTGSTPVAIMAAANVGHSTTRESFRSMLLREWPVYEALFAVPVRSSDNATGRVDTFNATAVNNQTKTYIVDRNSILSVMALAQMQQIASTGPEPEIQNMARLAEQDVLQAFANIEPVALIYSDRLTPMHHFTVFIRGDSYDDELMDSLLDREYQLLQSLDPYSVSFRYMPFVSRLEAKVYISSSSRLIFEG